jgi:hypothetical protein
MTSVWCTGNGRLLAPHTKRYIAARAWRATAAAAAMFCCVTFNTLYVCMYVCMYVCIYRKTDAPQLYPFPGKGHAARVTWARAYAPIPRRQTLQAGPLFV